MTTITVHIDTSYMKHLNESMIYTFHHSLHVNFPLSKFKNMCIDEDTFDLSGHKLIEVELKIKDKEFKKKKWMVKE